MEQRTKAAFSHFVSTTFTFMQMNRTQAPVFSCVLKGSVWLGKKKRAQISLEGLATISSSSNQDWKFNIVLSKVCTASGFNKFTLALLNLCKVFFFKLLPNVFLEREHSVIEHTSISNSPWEREPSLRKPIGILQEQPPSVPACPDCSSWWAFMRWIQQLVGSTREKASYLSTNLISK